MNATNQVDDNLNTLQEIIMKEKVENNVQRKTRGKMERNTSVNISLPNTDIKIKTTKNLKRENLFTQPIFWKNPSSRVKKKSQNLSLKIISRAPSESFVFGPPNSAQQLGKHKRRNVSVKSSHSFLPQRQQSFRPLKSRPTRTRSPLNRGVRVYSRRKFQKKNHCTLWNSRL